MIIFLIGMYFFLAPCSILLFVEFLIGLRKFITSTFPVLIPAILFVRLNILSKQQWSGLHTLTHTYAWMHKNPRGTFWKKKKKSCKYIKKIQRLSLFVGGKKFYVLPEVIYLWGVHYYCTTSFSLICISIENHLST